MLQVEAQILSDTWISSASQFCPVMSSLACRLDLLHTTSESQPSQLMLSGIPQELCLLTYKTGSAMFQVFSQLLKQCAAIGQKDPVWQLAHQDNPGAHQNPPQSRQVLRVPLEGSNLLLVGTTRSAAWDLPIVAMSACQALVSTQSSQPFGRLTRLKPAAHGVLSTARPGSLCAV